jgi:hypothetical protein
MDNMWRGRLETVDVSGVDGCQRPFQKECGGITEAFVTYVCVWIIIWGGCLSPAKETGTPDVRWETGRAVRVGCNMDQSNDLDYYKYRSSERPDDSQQQCGVSMVRSI